MLELRIHRIVRARILRRVAAVVALVLLFAGGCVFFREFERQVAADIKDNPVIVRHIGDIQSIKIDWTATGNEDGDDVFVFQVTGSKGAGILTAECVTVDAEREDVVSGRLRLASGETVDLFAE